ncbi:hypothetical protein FRB95_010822 [Tulasnella sp. JGI-2019a]|nr:hypothetical protein FRB95_010822 [Tulasnella sp. JGI-2019a]
MDPDSYRRIAPEHQRKAEAALALAQEQEMRNRGLQRRLALDRLRNEFGGHQYRQVNDPRAATKLREALSSSRSEEEKDRILEELGLAPPKPSVPPLRKQEKEAASPTAQTLKRDQARPPVSPTPNSGAAASSPTVATPKPAATAGHKVLSASLAIIDAIQTQLDTIRAEFVFPSTIEFNPTAPDNTPGLLHSHTNAPVLHYKLELIDLLTKLDATESGGSERMRSTRKALVLAVEEALDTLGEMKAEAWRKIRAKEECAPEL